MIALAQTKNRLEWVKNGHVFCADNHSAWMKQWAYLPTPVLLNDAVIRVYASFLDDHMIGRVGFVDVSAKDPTHILRISDTPCLDKGEPGAFDDSGVSVTCVLREQDKLIMYYMGWQRLHYAPYSIFSGVAVSHDGGETFVKTKECPILDRIEGQTNFRSAPSVVHDGDRWEIWAACGSGFQDINGKSLPIYGIARSEGTAFDSFQGEPQWCIFPDTNQIDTYGYGRPWIQKKDGKYLIWYSERSVSKIYRIKFATSDDGLNWQIASDSLCPQPSTSGWDSEMIAFSGVIETKHGTYMFHNGNGLGATGFGVATLTGTLNDLVLSAGHQ